MPCAYLL